MMGNPLEMMIKKVSLDPEARVAHEDIVAWTGSLSDWDFYNAISLRIAERYHAGSLSYSICDRIMNDLWRAVVDGLTASEGDEVPQPFYEIYEAFDAGEYHRKADLSDDPVTAYTNPMIKELLQHYLPTDLESATGTGSQ